MRVEVGVEIHVEAFCSETPDCEPQRRRQALFFYRYTNGYVLMNLYIVSMIHYLNRAVALEEFRVVMIAEPWAALVQTSYDR